MIGTVTPVARSRGFKGILFLLHLSDGWFVRLQCLHAVRLLSANSRTLNQPNVVKFGIVGVQLTICTYIVSVSILVPFMVALLIDPCTTSSNWLIYVHIVISASYTGVFFMVMFVISFSTSIHFKC